MMAPDGPSVRVRVVDVRPDGTGACGSSISAWVNARKAMRGCKEEIPLVAPPAGRASWARREAGAAVEPSAMAGGADSRVPGSEPAGGGSWYQGSKLARRHHGHGGDASLRKSPEDGETHPPDRKGEIKRPEASQPPAPPSGSSQRPTGKPSRRPRSNAATPSARQPSLQLQRLRGGGRKRRESSHDVNEPVKKRRKRPAESSDSDGESSDSGGEVDSEAVDPDGDRDSDSGSGSDGDSDSGSGSSDSGSDSGSDGGSGSDSGSDSGSGTGSGSGCDSGSSDSTGGSAASGDGAECTCHIGCGWCVSCDLALRPEVCSLQCLCDGCDDCWSRGRTWYPRPRNRSDHDWVFKTGSGRRWLRTDDGRRWLGMVLPVLCAAPGSHEMADAHWDLCHFSTGNPMFVVWR